MASNQRGVARGLVTQRGLGAIEERIQADLEPFGCRIDAFRYCVHEVDERCACRKPAPGLLLELATELAVDLQGSWMVGDSETDVAAGRAAGCRTALVDPGARPCRAAAAGPDLAAPSLLAAARAIAAITLDESLR